ncbi:uncharacterized protein DFL_002641 [Arthrobotrys flagrans]|uniref:Uncharacterized protein n=1 Tax=Arthrobotrys flagrans TaxID=97331 RepID=A0A437ABG0_ARTFL|nr:hypothetical protein DFL_002641 [Arthrobotrys flagrans]
MPITWTPENVSRLFLVTLAVHHIHMDYKQIAVAFGGDASPRAIEEKMKKLRKEAREFGDGTLDFLVSRGRKDGGGKPNGKGGVSKARHNKGRARPIKYEDGRIKWEYDNREDDSEGESGGLSSRGYGDLMECYLMKKENKVEGGVENGGTHVGMAVDEAMEANPNPYYMVDPMFSTGGYDQHQPMLSEQEQLLQMEAEDIRSVMDPMLTNGLSNMSFQNTGTVGTVENGSQDGNAAGSLAWEHNQDLRDLNNEFRAINHDGHGELMDIEGGMRMEVGHGDHGIDGMHEEVGEGRADVDVGRVQSERMDTLPEMVTGTSS